MPSQALVEDLPQGLAIRRPHGLAVPWGEFDCGHRRLLKSTVKFRGKRCKVAYNRDEVSQHPRFKCAREDAIFCYSCERPILVGLAFILCNPPTVTDIYRDVYMIDDFAVACVGNVDCNLFWPFYARYIWNGRDNAPELIYDALVDA